MPVTAILTFGLTSLVIHAAGTAAYGQISLLSTLALLLPFADLGIGAFLTNAVAEATTETALAELQLGLLKAYRVLLAAAVILVGSAGALAILLGWNVILGVRDPVNQFNLACFVTLSIFALSLPLGAGQRILLGSGRNQLVVLISPLSNLVALVVAAVLAALHTRGALYATCVPVGLLVTAGVSTGLADRTSPMQTWSALRLAISRGVPTPRIALRGTALPALVILIAQPIALQTDRIVLNFAGRDHALASYSLGAQLYASLWSIISASGATLWPIFARRRQSHSVRQSLRFCEQATLISAAIGSLFGGLSVWPGRALLGYVSGHQVEVSLGISVTFAVLIAAQAATLPAAMYLTRPRDLRFQAICLLAMLLVNLPLSFALAKGLGGTGPVIASCTAIALTQFLPYWVRLSRSARHEG